MLRHLALFLGLGLFLSACGGDSSPGRIAFTLALPELEGTAVGGMRFQGWAVVDGLPISTGQFEIDDTTTPHGVRAPGGGPLYGTTAAATFGPANTGLGISFPFIVNATGFFVTREPSSADDGVPAGVLMAGNFSGQTCTLTGAGSATGLQNWTLGDWTSATGAVVLRTPTQAGPATNQGVWFDTGGATPAATLSLPALQSGWCLQGWVINGEALSLGQFLSATGPDLDAQSAPTRGAMGIGDAFPGQDFVTPVVVNIPVCDFSSGDWEVRITAEPTTDNAVAPFPLTVLAATIPTTALNAAGASAGDVALAFAATQQPQLLMQIQNPTAATFSGTAPAALGAPRDGEYALWANLITATQPQLITRLRVDGSVVINPANGLILGSTSAFSVDSINSAQGIAFPDLTLAASVHLTVEAQGGPWNAAPSAAVLLAGSVAATGSATLSVAGLSAQGGLGLANFSAAAGSCIVAAPTADVAAGAPSEDRHGVWFVDHSTRLPALTLPTLPAGWSYEGWVVRVGTGQRYSTGKFHNPAQSDADAATWGGAGPNAGYSAPGQDFLNAVNYLIPPIPFNATVVVLVTLELRGEAPLSPSPWHVLFGNLPNAVDVPGPALLNQAANLPGGTVSFH